VRLAILIVAGGALSLFALNTNAAAQDGIVHLNCTNVDTTVTKPLPIQLVLNDGTWKEYENPSEQPTYFTGDTHGKYFPLTPNHMILHDLSGKQVGELNPFTPGTAQSGNHDIKLGINSHKFLCVVL
jgi:hypothetical protein